MKKISIISFMLLLFTTAWADNILSLTTTDGNNGDEITVTASLTLTSEATAAQIDLPLGKYLTYVDGSCSFTADRLDGHTTSVNIDGDTLKIFVYSAALKSIKQGEGTFFSFKLKCGTEPGTYQLSPSMILSDAEGKEISSTCSPTSMTLYAGKVSAPKTLDFTKAIVGQTNTMTLTIQNTGNKSLHVSNVIPSFYWITVSPTNFDLAAGASTNINVTVTPTDKAIKKEKLTIVSDAGNSSVDCQVNITAIKINQISFPTSLSATGGSEVTVDVGLENQEEAVAVEFSIDMPDGIEFVANSCSTTARTEGLNVSAAQKDGKCTVYLYSLTNKVIEGTSGTIMSFKIKPNVKSGTYTLTASDIKILNSSGENISYGTASTVLTVNSGRISTIWDNGHQDIVPVDSLVDDMLEIRNSGNSDLVISGIQFKDDFCFTQEEFPIYLSANERTRLKIQMKINQPGDYTSYMTVLSNDPVTPEQKLLIKTKAVGPNHLALSGTLLNDQKDFSMSVSLNNIEAITGVQMDIHCPTYMTTELSSLTIDERIAKTHQASVSKISDGLYRVILYSLNNTAIEKGYGKLLTIKFSNTSSTTITQNMFSVDNVVIGDKAGKNYNSIDAYGFYNLRYYQYKNQQSTSYSVKRNVVVGTGTPIDRTKGWIGEPVIMGSKDRSVYTWGDVSLYCKAIFYDEDRTTILKQVSVAANTTVTAPTPAVRQGRLFYGWELNGNIVSRQENYSFTIQENGTFYAVYTSDISISQTSLSLEGGTKTVLKILYGSDKAEYSKVTWSSNNSQIATVSSNGTVRAVGKGTTTIIAEIPNVGLSYTCVVTVTSDAPLQTGYQYYMWKITKCESSTIQMGEFALLDSNSDEIKSLVCTGGPSGQSGEGWENLTAHSPSKKYCKVGFVNPSYFFFDAGESVSPVGYRIYTANDSQHNNRNPKSWQLYGSNEESSDAESEVWTLLADVEDDEVMQHTNLTPYDYDIPQKSTSIPGDANNDKKVDIADIAYLISYLKDKTSVVINVTAADVDGNGEINATDITGIVNIISGRK